jgi:peptidoglycan DL-endopeptidase LytE
MVFVKFRFLVTLLALGCSSALAGSYTVQPKDTLFSIAKKFNSSVAALQKLNQLTGTGVSVGQVLTVPDPQQTHVVAAKETLFSIASKYGVSVAAILEANKLSSSNLKIGQRLIIPVSSSTSSSTAAPTKPPTSSVPTKPNDKPLTGNPDNPIVPPAVDPFDESPPQATVVTPKPPVTVKPINIPSSSTKPPTSPTVSSSGTKPQSSNPQSSVQAPTTTASSASSLPPRPLSVTAPKPPVGGNVKPTISSANTGTVLPTGRGSDMPITVSLVKTAPLPNLSSPPSIAASQTTLTDTKPDQPEPNSSDPSGDPSEAPPELLHTVAAGETLFRIALKYKVSIEEIRAANNLSSDAISIGQQLKIPVTVAVISPQASNQPSVREVSQRYLGVTYRYGGTNPSAGLDCSGFVQIVFAELGLKLPRTSALQFQAGIAIERENLREGDLVFFDTTGRGVSHVGIYLGDERFIHAASNPGKVTVSSLTEKYWQPKYLGARRVLTDD